MGLLSSASKMIKEGALEPSANPAGTGLQNLPRTGVPMYDALYKANPYRNLTYNKSPWQSFLGTLGFRTDYDRFLEEAQVNSAEYDAQVASIMQQNEYNSESAKVAQMRDAGLNPDLLGTNGVSDSASPTQDVNGMSTPGSDTGEFGEITQKLWNFGTSILSLYQVGVGLAKDMLSMRQMQNAVANQDFDMATKFMTFANDYVLNNAPAEPFMNAEDYNEHVSGLRLSLENFPRFLGFDRRRRKIWNSVTSRRYFNSEDFRRMTESWLKGAQNVDSLSKTKRYFFNDQADEWSAFDIISRDLGDLADSVYRMKQKEIKDVSEAGSATAMYQKELNETRSAFRDPATGATGAQTQVASEMSGYKLSYQSQDVERKINSTMQRIVNDLESSARDGDLLASGLLLAMQIFRMSNFSFGSKTASVGLRGF